MNSEMENLERWIFRDPDYLLADIDKIYRLKRLEDLLWRAYC